MPVDEGTDMQMIAGMQMIDSSREHEAAVRYDPAVVFAFIEAASFLKNEDAV